MSIKLIVLERAVKWLVGGELLSFVNSAVIEVNREDISGSEKRAIVYNKAKELFTGFASVFINLAIEVSVVILMAKIAEEGK